MYSGVYRQTAKCFPIIGHVIDKISRKRTSAGLPPPEEHFRASNQTATVEINAHGCLVQLLVCSRHAVLILVQSWVGFTVT